MDKFTIVQDDGYVGLYKNGFLVREHPDLIGVLDELPNLSFVYSDIGVLGLETFPLRLEDL